VIKGQKTFFDRLKGWVLDPIQEIQGVRSLPFVSKNIKIVTSKKWDPESPLLSVVIPCYNHGQYLAEVVDSVLDQTWQDVEILIVNDGSDEAKTVNLLEEFSRPKTTLFHHAKNQGLPTARNTGIQHACGKYICCLDADDKLHPTYLEKALCLLESNLGIGLVYSWTQVFGEEQRVWYAPQFDPAVLIDHNQLNPPAVFHRKAWESVGGFREEMKFGYEDWEFWIRLARAGFRGYRIPEKLIFVRRVGRSFIHQAVNRHDQLVAEIRRSNPAVYQDLSWLDDYAKNTPDVYLDEPLLNLSDPNSFLELTDPVLWIHRQSSRKLEINLDDIRQNIGRHEGDFIFVSTTAVREEVLDLLYTETVYVYILPHFLPRYMWDDFIDKIVVKQRGALKISR
jgi:glycosyltransferase involved in cell wall biosynthesis